MDVNAILHILLSTVITTTQAQQDAFSKDLAAKVVALVKNSETTIDDAIAVALLKNVDTFSDAVKAGLALPAA